MKSDFKHTEVGVIPSDWEVKAGEELSEKITKGASPRWQGFEYQKYGVLFVTSENVRDGFLDISVQKFLPQSFSEKQNNSRLKKGDLLINIVGASIGRACIYNLNTDANINQAVCLFRPNRNVNHTYLLHFFQSPQIIQKLVGSQAESARPNLSLTDIRKFRIALPPTLAEQTAIATALNDADELIQKLEQLIAKKRNIKTGAMQELLRAKEGWVVKKLKEITQVSRENIIPYLSPKTIYAHFSLPAFDNNRKTIAFEPGENIKSNKFKVQKDSILISKLNPRIPRIWKPNIIPENSIASTEFIILTCKEGVSKEYLFSFCSSNSFSKQLEQAVTGTTGSHQRIKPEDAIQIEISYPKDETEQIKISLHTIRHGQ